MAGDELAKLRLEEAKVSKEEADWRKKEKELENKEKVSARSLGQAHSLDVCGGVYISCA